MDGDTVMMDLGAAKYYGIGGAGNLIWRQLETPRDLLALLESVRDEYDVPEDRAREDIEAFLSKLLDAGLVCKV